MEKVLGGIAQISRIPAALFLVDIGHEHIALSEAKRLNITTFGMVDTNCDPSEVDYVIPGNDYALRAIRLFAAKMADSVAEGAQYMSDKQDAELAAAAGARQAQMDASQAASQGATEVPAGEEAPAEEISMEDVLGGGVRKQPAVECQEV